MYKESFPSRLKQARLLSGYTQKEIEEITSIKQTVLSRYENGQLEPNIETIGLLADLYQTDINWLFGIVTNRKTEV